MAGQADPTPAPSATAFAPARGTDIVSSFAGWGPTTVVRPGRLWAPSLHVALDSWDRAGRSVRDEVGELVEIADLAAVRSPP
jgi:hypothetical protein